MEERRGMIPKNIKIDHIIKALKNINKYDFPKKDNQEIIF